MSSIIPASHDLSIPPAYTQVLPQASIIMADSHPETSSEEPSSLDVTSNIRQGLPCPDPPTLHHHSNSLLSQIRTAIPADSIYSLPAPDLAPRFVLKADEPQIDETMLIQEPGGAYDIPVYPQTPSYDPSCSPPRIYFADSAITFVPPLCYDYLERDPDVKGVPRNYRAWMRTGRPRLELDGVERAEAKSDFASMGLVFPRDGESEADGDENENEKKRKRKKKQAAKALMVPIERPRRMVKKPGDTGLLTPQSLPPIAAADKDFKEVISQPEIIAVQIVKEAQKGLVLDVAEKSDGSERRSTSTLLESDSAEIPGKRKRRENGQYYIFNPLEHF
ncbi:hypothetical protein K439DRAFT_75745 [Ramaria rubella]|nr:hypothetical protein K439DRAFT_75745 [Ramaria rubella]